MNLAAEFRGFKQYSLECSTYPQAKSGAWKASLLLLMAVMAKPVQAGETFTSAEFLKWKLESQESYFRTNIGMASLIAAQNDKKHARCIEEWFTVDERRARDYILKVMREYPDHHPRGVIVAILKQKCGSFNYAERAKLSSR